MLCDQTVMTRMNILYVILIRNVNQNGLITQKNKFETFSEKFKNYQIAFQKFWNGAIIHICVLVCMIFKLQLAVGLKMHWVSKHKTGAIYI